MESGGPELSDQDRREDKERRRRERRERRARRQRHRQSDLVHQMDGYCYEGGGGCLQYGDHLPDLLNSHVPPPPYTTLPGRGHGAISSSCPASDRTPAWRPSFPGFSRR